MPKEETPKEQSENSQEIPDQQRKDSAQTELSDQNDPLKPENDENKDKAEDVQEKVENDADNPLNHDDATTELSDGKSKNKKKGKWFKSLFGRKRAMSVEEQEESRKNIAASLVGALKRM